jgi:choline-glycine betaine transporter
MYIVAVKIDVMLCMYIVAVKFSEIRLGSREHLLPDFWGANFVFQNFSKNSEKNHART